ncbi:hypothetical protein CSKR_114201 [Clonorchis sinensis]|uniref:Uncharacterized protein n=1 Tax=Clonorchis sinensis TaxID=79923 RepID=A0A419PWA6_CLOSI|nr:hypothetical protein CSKR_114201 [Clonorchis sinensis]
MCFAAQICNENLPADAGSLESPGYPLIYPNDLNCTWTIGKPNGMGHLSFVDFDVSVRNITRFITHSPLIHCGNANGNLQTDVVYIFGLRSNVFTPSVLHRKRPSAIAKWSFSSLKQIEDPVSGSECVWDYVTITVGTGSLAKVHGPFCGYTKPPSIPFSDVVKITFVADAVCAYKGFQITYSAGKF